MFYVCKYVSDQLGQFLWERVNAGFSLASGFVTPIPILWNGDNECKWGGVKVKGVTGEILVGSLLSLLSN